MCSGVSPCGMSVCEGVGVGVCSKGPTEATPRTPRSPAADPVSRETRMRRRVVGIGAQPYAHQLDMPAHSSWAPPWLPRLRSATSGPTLPSSATCPQKGAPMRPRATGVSDAVGGHCWGGGFRGKGGWGGALGRGRTAERSWAGAGSRVRGRRGHPEVPAPLGRAWVCLDLPGPLGQQGCVGGYLGPVLQVQEGALTQAEALSSSERWHHVPPTPPLGVLASGEITRG